MIKSLVVIGDAYAFHGTDIAWMDFLRHFDKKAFLHTGQKRYIHDYAFAQDDASDIVFFDTFKKEFGEVDVLIGRFSHFSKWLETEVLNLILDIIKPRIFILGYHCHLSKILEKEKNAFSRAQALILLNELQNEYFSNLYNYCSKPVFFLRSLYLPRRSWYGAYPGKKTGIHFGLGGQVIRESGRFSVKPFIEALYPALRANEVRATIFGDVKQIDNNAYYKEIFGFMNVNVPGPLEPKKYQAYLQEEISYGSLSGFKAKHEVSQFDRENYPIRLNSYIKANVVPLSISYGYEHVNKLMQDEKFGFIFNDYQEIFDITTSLKAYDEFALTEKEWLQVCERNSFDFYSQSLVQFLSEIE